jgi:hypothetical protein
MDVQPQIRSLPLERPHLIEGVELAQRSGYRVALDAATAHAVSLSGRPLVRWNRYVVAIFCHPRIVARLNPFILPGDFAASEIPGGSAPRK